MKELYSHKVNTSFYLWYDHILLQQGGAHTPVSTELYYRNDERVSNDYVNYSSPFKQWVWDSSVDGAVIPSGISGVNGFIPRGQDDLKLDFDNGRIFINSGVGATGAFSGTYSIKTFNTYSVTQEEQGWIYEQKYQLNSKYGIIPETGVSPYDYAIPACFITNATTDNTPFALGGEQTTKFKFRVIIVGEDKFSVEGCVSLFRDKKNTCVPFLSSSNAPLNEFGDVKSGVYRYADYLTSIDRKLFIDDVKGLFITSDAEKNANPNLKFAILDFYLSEQRIPNQDI